MKFLLLEFQPIFWIFENCESNLCNMKRSGILKYIISFCFILIVILPIINRELFVSKTGQVGYPESFVVILIVIALFKEWRFVKEILLVLLSIVFVSIFFWVLTGIINQGILGVRTGYYLYMLIIPIIIISLIQLKRVEMK